MDSRLRGNDRMEKNFVISAASVVKQTQFWCAQHTLRLCVLTPLRDMKKPVVAQKHRRDKQTQFNKAHHEVLEGSRRNLFTLNFVTLRVLGDELNKQSQFAHRWRETLNPKH